MAPESRVEPARATFAFVLLFLGLLVAFPVDPEAPGPPRFDSPVPGFRTLPGVKELRVGEFVEGVRLRIVTVIRGPGISSLRDMKRSEARIELQLEGRDGAEISVLEPGRPHLTAAEGIYAYCHIPITMFSHRVQEDGWIVLGMGGLPDGPARIPAVEFDIRVFRVKEKGKLRFFVNRDEDLEIEFLDQQLYVKAHGRDVDWGHDYRPHSPYEPLGTCLQGMLDSYELHDGLGYRVEYSTMTGRSFGTFHRWSEALAEKSLPFPLRVDATWKRCGPTISFRVRLENLEIPAQ